MAGAGYDIGVSLSSSPSATAANSGAVEVKGGGVTYNIAGSKGSVTATSSTKTLLTVIAIVIGVALVSFVAWKLVR